MPLYRNQDVSCMNPVQTRDSRSTSDSDKKPNNNNKSTYQTKVDGSRFTEGKQPKKRTPPPPAL